MSSEWGGVFAVLVTNELQLSRVAVWCLGISWRVVAAILPWDRGSGMGGFVVECPSCAVIWCTWCGQKAAVMQLTEPPLFQVRKTMRFAALLVVLPCVFAQGSKPEGRAGWETSASSPTCPCSNDSLCKPIERVGGENVFAFHMDKDIYIPTTEQVWRKYNWSLITTVCVFGPIDPELFCYAHSKGVRVTLGTIGPAGWDNWDNATTNQKWIDGLLSTMAATFTDGFNIDIEQGVTNDSRIPALTELVKNASDAVHAVNPHAQMSFDAPSLGLRTETGECGQDYNRRYNYTGLAEALDFLVTMDYDTNIKWSRRYHQYPQYYANIALPIVESGVECLTQNLSVPASKIVLAFPWYSYEYICAPGDVPPVCNYVDTGVMSTSTAQEFISNGTATSIWQTNTSTPHFFYTRNGSFVRVDYDNRQSLRLKYTYAKTAGVRGIGMWAASTLNYSNPTYSEFWEDMGLF